MKKTLTISLDNDEEENVLQLSATEDFNKLVISVHGTKTTVDFEEILNSIQELQLFSKPTSESVISRPIGVYVPSGTQLVSIDGTILTEGK